METGRSPFYSGPRKGSLKGCHWVQNIQAEENPADTLGKRLQGKLYVVCRGLSMIDIKIEYLILIGKEEPKG